MKKMSYLLITLSLSLTAFHLSAQSLERFVIGSAGFSNQNKNLQLSFTVGETVVNSFNTDALQLSQGFQQPNIEEVTTAIELPAFVHEIVAYPNPVENIINLDIYTTKSFEFSLEMFDLTGKKQMLPPIGGKTSGQTKYQIDITRFGTGLYHLLIKTKEGVPVKVFKIRKM